jgi:hypothetical protein
MINSSSSSSNSNLDGDIEVHLDLSNLANHLVKNPAFIEAVAKAIRDQQTKDARKMGNLYSKWAQTTPPAKPTRNRAQ